MSLIGAAARTVTFQDDTFDRRTGKQLDADANGTVDRREAWVWMANRLAATPLAG